MFPKILWMTMMLCTLSRRIHASNHSQRAYRVHLAVGSNVGDRYHHIHQALQALSRHHDVKTTSFLYQTEAMYITDQPPFLNGAIVLETDDEPHDLLKTLKSLEVDAGRDLHGLRNGPRPMDLDILLYEDGEQLPLTIESDTLEVPHPRMNEREFVLQPLVDLNGRAYPHPTSWQSLGSLLDKVQQSREGKAPVRVIPLPRQRFLAFNSTLVMGVLNVTPDSFSDGGKYDTSVDAAVKRALEMERQGVDIIDVGGESTRPGASPLTANEEIQRTVPVIRAIREKSDCPISIDTRRSKVARAAVEAGADVVNDVSGGTFEEEMLPTVAELGVPVVLMHMRGTPETMTSLTDYDDVVEDVGNALSRQIRLAEEAGIPRWMIIADPGIGFAKNLEQNLALLANLSKLRERVKNVPLLIGTSRKRFIGTLSGIEKAEDRDSGSIASWVASFGLESKLLPSIVRVHDVAAAKQATQVLDAILLTRETQGD